MAVSLDGYIATPDGDVAWLDPYFDEDYGYAGFIEGIGSAVMGRVTYEQLRGFGEWPYEGLDVHVLTSAPLDDLPPSVRAWNGSARELAEELVTGSADGDCWIIGGGRTIRSFDRLDLVDERDLFIMPVLLGDGVPLCPSPYPARALSLTSVARWENGVVRLSYGRARADEDLESQDDADVS